MQARKYLIAGNWKMNCTAPDAKALIESIIEEVGDQSEVGVVVCPPYTALETASNALSSINNIQLGAQNMHFESSGAFTGEISAPMLRTFYVSYVILGHSERRQYFGETDELVNQKAKAALDANLKPIICLGETIDEREAGTTMDVITKQLEGCFADIPPASLDNVVIAYEPVWAIGTGKTATPEMAQEVHLHIRSWLTQRYSGEEAAKVRILYGGSMKPANADELLAQPDIDGGLIGGASLDGKNFGKLVASAKTAATA